MPKFAPILRVGLVIFGALLVIGTFLAVLYLGIGTNAPPLHIAVAARDISQGERLNSGDYRIVEQIIDPKLARLYVQESDLPQFTGAYVVETMRKGDPVNKVKLTSGDSKTALNRYSLSLDDPNVVIMNLPVNPDIIPSKISQGDFVNILFAGGSENGINRLPEPKATSELAAELPLAVDAEALTDAQKGQIGSEALVLTVTAPTPAAEIVLPLADLMLEHVEILDVNYQQLQNSAYGTDGKNGDQAYINGLISSIVVKVPRSHQTLLMFGASLSKLRFALASPKVDARTIQPQMGMDWGKYVTLYRWKEAQVVSRGEMLTQTLYPGVGTINAGISITQTGSLAQVPVAPSQSIPQKSTQPQLNLTPAVSAPATPVAASTN